MQRTLLILGNTSTKKSREVSIDKTRYDIVYSIHMFWTKTINDSINKVQNSVGNDSMYKLFRVQLKHLTLFYLKMYLSLNVNQLNLNCSII